VLTDLGKALLMHKEYGAAVERFAAALALRRATVGEEHRWTAHLYHLLGAAHDLAGQRHEGRLMHERKLAIREKIGFADVAKMGDEYAHVAWSCMHQRDFDAALVHFQLCLRHRAAALGRAHLKTASALNGLGKALMERGQYRKAIGAHEEALAIRQQHAQQLQEEEEEAPPDAAPGRTATAKATATATATPTAAVAATADALAAQVAESLHNLGVAHLQQGHTAQALQLLRRSVAAKRALYGAAHVYLAAGHNALGKVYYRRGHFALAVAQHEACLRLRRAAYGPDSPAAAGSFSHLAWCHIELEDYDRAVACMQECLRIRMLSPLPQPSGLAWAHTGLATAYYKKGDYENARVHHERSLELRRPSAQRAQDMRSLLKSTSGQQLFFAHGSAAAYAALAANAMAVLILLSYQFPPPG